MISLGKYKYRNSKIYYYVKNYLKLLAPAIFPQPSAEQLLARLTDRDLEGIEERVHYYNQCDTPFQLDQAEQTIQEFTGNRRRTVYFLDSVHFLRRFDPAFRVAYEFGDVTTVPEVPSIVKSRPIAGDIRNSVVLKLEKRRHFFFLKQDRPFEQKKGMLVWRGAADQPHRQRMVQQYFDHPLCDIGQTNRPKQDVPWQKDFMSIGKQLTYKYILSIEGFDVATGLKWLLSSNSLCMMVKPTYETWFMEGRLVPGKHYVLIQDDYSDLAEKIEYYNRHPDEALEIIQHAHQYVEQFKHPLREDAISMLVLEKYFELSNNQQLRYAA